MKIQLGFDIAQELHADHAGTDEVGRGPLAGDVVAAAVILDPAQEISGLADSKRLSARQRQSCYQQILEKARAHAIARASVAEIDSINIFKASLLAMHRAVQALQPQPEFVYVDGTHCPAWDYPSEAVVKGDARIAAIAAASILAKVCRDREMEELHDSFPEYGFDRHKGYPTAAHLKALKRHGPCPAHRRSYAPVAAVLEEVQLQLERV